MRRYLLAAVAVGAIATPAAARDNQGYFGVEAGIAWIKDQNADAWATRGMVTHQIDPINLGPPLRYVRHSLALDCGCQCPIDAHGHIGRHSARNWNHGLSRRQSPATCSRPHETVTPF